MGITALTLGGWVSVYCGVSLLRSTLPELHSDQARSASGRKLAYFGSSLVIVGVVILARSMIHLLR